MTAVKSFREAVAAADAVLFASPEYNYGVSGPLKNAIDWGEWSWAWSAWTALVYRTRLSEVDRRMIGCV